MKTPWQTNVALGPRAPVRRSTFFALVPRAAKMSDMCALLPIPRCKLALCAVAVAFAAAMPAASADSLTDYFGPRAVGAGEAARADAHGALAIALNPAGLALDHQFVFEGGYGFRPGDSSSLATASACDSTTPVAGCFYYRYFLAKPEIEGTTYRRRVHETGTVLARALGQSLAVGIGVKYFDYNSNLADAGREGEQDAAGFASDVGAVFRATGSLSLAAVGYNVIAEDSPQYPLALGGGIAFRATSNLALGADGVWNLEAPEGQGTGRYSAGASFFASAADGQAGYPIRAGVVHDAGLDGTYITAGLGYVTAKLGVDVGARKQVAGGDELVILGSLRLFGPQVTAAR